MEVTEDQRGLRRIETATTTTTEKTLVRKQYQTSEDALQTGAQHNGSTSDVIALTEYPLGGRVASPLIPKKSKRKSFAVCSDKTEGTLPPKVTIYYKIDCHLLFGLRRRLANFPVPATPTPCSQSALGVLMVYAPFPSVPYSVHALCKIDFLPKIISRAFGAHIYTYEHSFGLSQVRRPQADHV